MFPISYILHCKFICTWQQIQCFIRVISPKPTKSSNGRSCQHIKHQGRMLRVQTKYSHELLFNIYRYQATMFVYILNQQDYNEAIETWEKIEPGL